MKFKESSRLNQLETSVFTTISKLSFEHNAVNLGQGFPDFDGPDWLMKYAFEAMLDGKNQYPPSNGIHSLRNIISKIQKKNYDLNWVADKEITITSGATEGLFSALQAIIEPGDEVIIFEPFYDAYLADILMAGGVPKFVTLKKPDFKFDFEELEKAITTKTKSIILNSPHNPTGKVFDKSELEFISELVVKYNLIALSDEVYEFLTFDDVSHIPIATFPEMRDRTITITSAAKTFSITGWKIGFVMASESITQAIQKVHQWTVFAVNTPCQHAVARAYERIEDYLTEFRAMYQSKRDLVFKELLNTSFKPYKPYGSYFLMVEYPQNIYENDFDCAIDLIKKYGIATIPPSVFYRKSDEGKTMLRLCFAKKDETLLRGISRLKNIP